MIPDPMLASPAPLADIGVFIVGDIWVMEQKIDGHRVRWNLTTGEFTNRAGEVYTKNVPKELRDFHKVDDGYVLDGELLDGKFYAFDILQEGTNLHLYPLHERREILVGLVSALQNVMLIERRATLEAERFDLPLQVVPQATTTEEKTALAERVIRENLEGVLVKRRDSIYRGGRETAWMKCKIETTADVVVMAVRDDGKESARLGIYLQGKLVEIGRCSLIGKPPVKVGDVVEVKYLYVSKDARLYQPTLVRVRMDKKPEECDGRDFRVVNKSVIKVLD